MIAMLDGLEERPLRINLQPDDVLLYVHIPKTGGTSLISILDSKFPERKIFPLHSPANENLFWAFTPQELKQFRFVRGHYRFGPYDESVYRHISQNPICITMLRDPIQRTVSSYRHIIRTPDHRLHATLLANGSTLRDYLTREEYLPQITNLQTRIVVGAYPARPSGLRRRKTISDKTMVMFAKQRLEQYAFVGLMERFEESIELLTYTFDWPDVEEIPRLNIASDSFSPESIEEDLLEIMRHKTALDRKLYHHAQNIFQGRVERMKTARQRSI